MSTPFSEPPIQRGYSQGYNPQPQPGTSSTALVIVGLCTVMCLFCCCGGVFLLPLAIARLPSPMERGRQATPARRPGPVLSPRAGRVPGGPVTSSMQNDLDRTNDQKEQFDEIRQRSMKRMEDMRKRQDEMRQRSQETRERMMRDLRPPTASPPAPGPPPNRPPSFGPPSMGPRGVSPPGRGSFNQP
jgi:hypothetical protein